MTTNNCICLQCTAWYFDIHKHCKITSTIMLMNISITSHSYHCVCVCVCVCAHVVRILKIYLLSKSQVYNMVLLTRATMLYIVSRIYSSCITETLYPFTNISPFPQTPAILLWLDSHRAWDYHHSLFTRADM